MSKKLRVGIVGGAFAGNLHAEGWLATNRAEVVAIAAPTKNTRDSFSRRFGSRSYEDAKIMLEKEELDVISLTLPNVYHKELTVLAASKGIHVVCEKPLSINLQDAKEMIDVAEKADIKLLYAEQIIFAPRYRKVKELIENGSFGQIVHVSHRERHGGPHSRWFRDINMSGGGVTMDMGIHGIGLIAHLLKPAKITHVYARISTIDKNSPVDDHCLLTLEFDNHTLATVDASWVAPGGVDDVLEVLGRDGYVRADLARGQTMDVFTLSGSSEVGEKAETNKGWLKIPHEEARTWGWYAEIEHFAAVILDGITPMVTGEDGYQALKVVMAAYESSRTNQRVEVN
ncbi:MAG: Gfo/Idh/MocA family protein [Candidatus Nanopelagicaceae bacterium]